RAKQTLAQGTIRHRLQAENKPKYPGHGGKDSRQQHKSENLEAPIISQRRPNVQDTGSGDEQGDGSEYQSQVIADMKTDIGRASPIGRGLVEDGRGFMDCPLGVVEKDPGKNECDQ